MGKILIVDDHPSVRILLRNILETVPEWEVCGEAKNGREAVSLAQDLNPDVIVMDISMPVMGGLVLCTWFALWAWDWIRRPSRLFRSGVSSQV